MTRVVRFLPLLAAALGLAGCASAPIHFYTLVPISAPVANSVQPAAYRIAVMPVTVPAQVDQPQMVVREGPGQVTLLEGAQWIAPLGDEIRAAVSATLVQLLDTQDVRGLGAGEATTVYRVRLDVRRFDSVPGQHTALDAAWTVQARKAGSGLHTLQCASHLRQSVGAGVAALALGHQRGLTAMARQIAATIQAMAANPDGATCAPHRS